MTEIGGDASAKLRCPNSPATASKVRVFFTFAIDLADYQDTDDKSKEKLQALRASGRLQEVYAQGLATLDANYSSLAAEVKREAERARELDGKAVWSDTFLRTRALWIVPDLAHKFDFGEETLRAGQEIRTAGNQLVSWMFDKARSFLTVDGVFVVTVAFRKDAPSMISDLIVELKALRSRAGVVFEELSRRVVDQNSPLRKCLQSEGFSAGSQPNPEKIRTHRTIFVESFSCVGGLASCEAHRLGNTKAVAGLMNLTGWYDDYHEDYLTNLSSKEFGYRSSELYLTDKDTTIAVQKGFWADGDSLHLYMRSVLQAVEYHLGVQALLRGQLQYARNLYSGTIVNGTSSAESVEGVRKSRAILSAAYESLNYSVLVLHGFTRRLLRTLDAESEISGILADVERRVENVSDSVSLRSTVEISNSANRTNRRVLLATIVGSIAGILALIVSGLSLAAANGGDGSSNLHPAVNQTTVVSTK